jgi:hypothetical protein
MATGRTIDPDPTEIQNLGIQYEIDVVQQFSGLGYKVDPPAGPDSTKADLQIYLPKSNPSTEPVKIELKEKLSADFGQLNLDFDFDVGGFYIDENKKSNQAESAQVLIALNKSFNAIDKINGFWNPMGPGKTPNRFHPDYKTWNLQTRVSKYILDTQKFPSPHSDFISGPQVVDGVEKYYNSKGVYYLQIKNKGLYYMGSNPRNWNCSSLSDKIGGGHIRIRVKPNSKNKDRWSFLMALKLGALSKSDTSLDPWNRNALEKISSQDFA